MWIWSKFIFSECDFLDKIQFNFSFLKIVNKFLNKMQTCRTVSQLQNICVPQHQLVAHVIHLALVHFRMSQSTQTNYSMILLISITCGYVTLRSQISRFQIKSTRRKIHFIFRISKNKIPNFPHCVVRPFLEMMFQEISMMTLFLRLKNVETIPSLSKLQGIAKKDLVF